MAYLYLALLIGAVFGLCWLADKGFARIFRNTAQHKSGKAVRLNRHFGGAGVIVALLGLVSLLFMHGAIYVVAGIVMLLTGAGLIVYYMSFGVYYDDRGFVLSVFGRASVTYTYAQITAQQLYTTRGGTVLELCLEDGRTLQLQQLMSGVDGFLKQASAGWREQKGLTKEACSFYDPDNSCWFPPVKE